MELFKPPTDNLYKFAALSGIILALATSLCVYNLHLDLKKRAFDLDEEVAVWKVERQQMDELVAGMDVKKPTLSKDQLLEIRDKNIQLMGTREKLKIKSEMLTGELNLAEKTFRLLWALAIFGIVIALVGFLHWYWKLQRYQDELIKHEAQNVRARHSGTNPASSAARKEKRGVP